MKSGASHAMSLVQVGELSADAASFGRSRMVMAVWPLCVFCQNQSVPVPREAVSDFGQQGSPDFGHSNRV